MASQLMASSSGTRAFARRARRWAATPFRANSVRSLRDSLSKKPSRIMPTAESESRHLEEASFGFSGSRNIDNRAVGKAPYERGGFSF